MSLFALLLIAVGQCMIIIQGKAASGYYIGSVIASLVFVCCLGILPLFEYFKYVVLGNNVCLMISVEMCPHHGWIVPTLIIIVFNLTAVLAIALLHFLMLKYIMRSKQNINLSVQYFLQFI